MPRSTTIPYLTLAAVLLTAPLCPAQPPVLERLWEYPTRARFPMSVAVDELRRPYLYVALKDAGLAVLEVAKPTAPPREAATLAIKDLGGLHVMQVTQHGEQLYLALGDFFAAQGAQAGLAVVSVKDPRAPKVTALWTSGKTLHGAATVLVDGKYAYLGAMKAGVIVFDLSQPGKLTPLSTFQPEIDYPRKNPTKVQHPNARGFALVGKRLYVAYDAGGLRILDVSNPRQLHEIGRYANPGMLHKQQAYNNLVVEGDLVYAAVDYAGLEILNVKDTQKIQRVGWWNPWKADTLQNLWLNSPGHTNEIALDRAKRLVYLSAGGSELQVVDVRDPQRPTLAATHGAPQSERGVWGLTLGAEAVYVLYMHAIIPFRGTWSGIVAIRRL